MFRKGDLAIDKEVVREKVQVARSGDRWVENAHCSSRGVSCIDKYLASRQLLLPVQSLKRLARHQNFSAHFKVGRKLCLLQSCRIHLQRNRTDCFNVWSDVFPGGSIATPHATLQL